MGKVRIIGGINRSRILKFQDGVIGLRPTPDMVREKLFNWLGQDLSGKKCLDLFAGSGVLGFEALSRNAKSVTMVEISKIVIKDLKTNKERLKADNLTLFNLPASKYLHAVDEKFDIIFLDPPYESGELETTLRQIKVKSPSILNPSGVIYIEYHTKPDLTEYKIIKEAKPGFVNYALITL